MSILSVSEIFHITLIYIIWDHELILEEHYVVFLCSELFHIRNIASLLSGLILSSNELLRLYFIFDLFTFMYCGYMILATYVCFLFFSM